MEELNHHENEAQFSSTSSHLPFLRLIRASAAHCILSIAQHRTRYLLVDLSSFKPEPTWHKPLLPATSSRIHRGARASSSPGPLQACDPPSSSMLSHFATHRRIALFSLVLLGFGLFSSPAYASDAPADLLETSVRRSPLPARRSYDTHHYYAVETRATSGVDPREVAELLGAEFVERVGELQHHWLLRSEKPINALSARDVEEPADSVLERWSQIHQSRHTSSHGVAKRHHDIALSIKAVEKQEIRRRHKRDVIYSPWDTPHLYPQLRDPIPGPEPQPYPDPLPRPPPLASSKIVEVANQFDIRDPTFPTQWHLVNDKKLGNDLNLTGVWAQNITGKGVTVALIDDGVDMHSPDLKDNFVSCAGERLLFGPHSDLLSSSRCSSLAARTTSMRIQPSLSLARRTTSTALAALERLLPSGTMYAASALRTMRT